MSLPAPERPAAGEVHHPIPITPAPTTGVALVPLQPAAHPAVQSVQLPDGRIVTGYTLAPLPAAEPAPTGPRPAVSRTAVNIALGGVGFAAVCGGLVLLTSFIAALAAFIHQLIILAAVLFGGFVAVQILSHTGSRDGTTVNIRKAVFKRNHFHG